MDTVTYYLGTEAIFYIPSSNISSVIRIPYFSDLVNAGFPSPAEGYVEESLDLNQLLIKHPAATFIVRVTGDSMRDVRIHPNDLLIVDKSLPVKNGSIIIGAVNNEFTVKRFRKRSSGRITLYSENPDYPPIYLKEGQEFICWGVVSKVIHDPN